MAIVNEKTMNFVKDQICNAPEAGVHTEAMYAIDVDGENLSHEDVAQRIDVAQRHDTLLSFWFRTSRRESGVHLSTPASAPRAAFLPDTFKLLSRCVLFEGKHVMQTGPERHFDMHATNLLDCAGQDSSSNMKRTLTTTCSCCSQAWELI